MAGWSKQGHRDSPPHFLPINRTNGRVLRKFCKQPLRQCHQFYSCQAKSGLSSGQTHGDGSACPDLTPRRWGTAFVLPLRTNRGGIITLSFPNGCCTTVWLVFSNTTRMRCWVLPGSVQRSGLLHPSCVVAWHLIIGWPKPTRPKAQMLQYQAMESRFRSKPG